MSSGRMQTSTWWTIDLNGTQKGTRYREQNMISIMNKASSFPVPNYGEKNDPGLNRKYKITF